MSRTAFLLNSSSIIAQFETLEISHPNFLTTHYVVRNNTRGLVATTEEPIERTFVYCPMKIVEGPTAGDLDYALEIQFGDLGQDLPLELDAVVEADGMFVEPTLIYRTFRSDDLSTPMFGPITLKIRSFAFDRTGATFQATADRANTQKTGEIYTLNRFASLRAFI